jgi:hypothetical protein
MSHVLKVIEQKELNDGMVSFCFRCCEDPTTDSWCTVHLNLAETELKTVVAAHKSVMASHHEHKLAFRAGTHPAVKAANEA